MKQLLSMQKQPTLKFFTSFFFDGKLDICLGLKARVDVFIFLLHWDKFTIKVTLNKSFNTYKKHQYFLFKQIKPFP